MFKLHLPLLLEHLHGKCQWNMPITHNHYGEPIPNTYIDDLLVSKTLHDSRTCSALPIQYPKLVLVVVSPAEQPPPLINRSEVGGMSNNFSEFCIFDWLIVGVYGLQFDWVPCLLVELPTIVLDEPPDVDVAFGAKST